MRMMYLRVRLHYFNYYKGFGAKVPSDVVRHRPIGRWQQHDGSTREVGPRRGRCLRSRRNASIERRLATCWSLEPPIRGIRDLDPRGVVF
jgi:hypothetical protein